MSLIENEQTKYLATWLNTIASAAVVIGVLAPLAAAFYGGTSLGTPSPAALALGTVIWFLCGCALHLAARRILRGLRP